MTLTCRDVTHEAPANGISAVQRVAYVSEGDTHLNYMIDIALTAEFPLAGGAQ
jgi:hypothetical protein